MRLSTKGKKNVFGTIYDGHFITCRQRVFNYSKQWMDLTMKIGLNSLMGGGLKENYVVFDNYEIRNGSSV